MQRWQLVESIEWRSNMICWSAPKHDNMQLLGNIHQPCFTYCKIRVDAGSCSTDNIPICMCGMRTVQLFELWHPGPLWNYLDFGFNFIVAGILSTVVYSKVFVVNLDAVWLLWDRVHQCSDAIPYRGELDLFWLAFEVIELVLSRWLRT